MRLNRNLPLLLKQGQPHNNLQLLPKERQPQSQHKKEDLLRERLLQSRGRSRRSRSRYSLMVQHLVEEGDARSKG